MLRVQAVGDVAPRRSDAAAIFADVAATLAEGDLLFGQLECPLSTRGSPSAAAKLAMRTDPAVAQTLVRVGFDVVSVAGNHAMDYGAEAFADTLTSLAEVGIRACGGGATLAEARAPAIVEAAGRRVAFLGYSSILPTGYAAEPHRPGCAPMRAYTHYHPSEPDQPGTAPRVLTFADRGDLDALVADVRAARVEADVVAVSLHWGVHFARAVIADYQHEVAHAAIDAGADMILGHHPHILKGIGFHRGKPIIYSMGNFAIEQPSAFREDVRHDAAFATISAIGDGWAPGARYMLPPDTRHSAIFRVEIDDDGGVAVALRPCRIDDGSVPRLLDPATADADALFAYLAEITDEAGLSTRYRRDGAWIRAIAAAD